MAIEPVSQDKIVRRHAETQLNPRRADVPQPRQENRAGRLAEELLAIKPNAPLLVPPKVGPVAVSQKPNLVNRPLSITVTERRAAGLRPPAANAAPRPIPAGRRAVVPLVTGAPRPLAGAAPRPAAIPAAPPAALRRAGIAARAAAVPPPPAPRAAAPAPAPRAARPAVRAFTLLNRTGATVAVPRNTAPIRVQEAGRRALAEAIRRAPQQSARRSNLIDQIA